MRVAPIPRTIEQRKSDPHPIDDAQLRADIRDWTLLVLSRSGTGSGKIVIELDFHEWLCRGVRFGGSTSSERTRR